MARLDSAENEKILELHIECRVCAKKFSSLLTSGHEDLAITCPSCSNFLVAIIEDFSLKKAGNSLYKKRRYRI